MKIVAVIVTFNRPEMLARMLAALSAQTRRPDEVFVIDNGSDPAASVEFYPGARLFRCSRNLGGAGGFALAMDLFMDGDGEALLLCDDDGVPSPAMLEELERHIALLPYANALVLDDADPEALAFRYSRTYGPARLKTTIGARRDLEGRAERGIVPDIVSPFNGTLLRRDLIERVGTVSPRMFIWGDEVEFTIRAKSAGFPIGTVLSAIMTHPRSSATVRRSRLFGDVAVPQGQRYRIAFRNSGWNDTLRKRRLRGLVGVARQVVRLLSIGEWRPALALLPYHLDGALNLFALEPRQAVLKRTYADERQRMLTALRSRSPPGS